MAFREFMKSLNTLCSTLVGEVRIRLSYKLSWQLIHFPYADVDWINLHPVYA